MSRTKTLIWAVVLLVLAAFYYFYEVQGGRRRQEAARQRELLVHVSVDDVSGFTIKRDADTIAAQKRQEDWYLTEPLRVPGDKQTYRELVRYLAELRHLRLVHSNPPALEPFGLATPSLEIRLTSQATSPPVVIRLGGQNPTGDGYYTQVEGDPAVYLIRAAAKDRLDASLYDVRDKTVLAFIPAAVREVRVTYGMDTAVVLQRHEEAQWQIIMPVNAKADAQGMSALLRRLHESKIKTFIAEHPTELHPYGLDTPALSLTLISDKNPHDRTIQTLLVGKVDSAMHGVYAKRSDATNVFLLPQDFWDNLPKSATALRDKTLLQFERDQIARIEMQSSDRHISMIKTAPRQYRLAQPIATAADNDTVYSLLWDLQALQAKTIVAETSAKLAPYGLDVPRLRVTLFEASPTASAPSQTLLFGTEAPEQQGRYAKVAARPTIYLVDHTAAERLVTKTAFDLRDKKLLAFAPDTVRKIRLVYPTSAFTVERHGGSWRLSEPRRQKITQHWKVDNLLYAIRALEYAKIVSETTVASNHESLETPQVQITLWPEDAPPVGPLVIGQVMETEDAGPTLVYVQAGFDAPLGAIKADFLQNVPKTPADLTSGQ